MIYFTSDLHFSHDRHFIYEYRGYKDIDEMNEALIRNFNSVVNKDDDLYILGDLMMYDDRKGLSCLSRLNGRLHLIIGNHDSRNRIEKYRQLTNVVEITYATVIYSGKKEFFICHYPCQMSDGVSNGNRMWCLHGHTHSNQIFQFPEMQCYNVSLDAHNNYPVSFNKIKDDIGDYKTAKAKGALKEYLNRLSNKQ